MHVPAVLSAIVDSLEENDDTLSSEDSLKHQARLLRFVVRSLEQQFE